MQTTTQNTYTYIIRDGLGEHSPAELWMHIEGHAAWTVVSIGPRPALEARLAKLEAASS
jgi:hypothetical protein